MMLMCVMCVFLQVERKCDKCGSEQMTYTTQQTRSVDEGQTVFFTCPNCQYANITPTSHVCNSLSLSLFLSLLFFRHQEVEHS